MACPFRSLFLTPSCDMVGSPAVPLCPCKDKAGRRRSAQMRLALHISTDSLCQPCPVSPLTPAT
eukprot:1148597-Pelagomonas_calceolata.AAC.14